MKIVILDGAVLNPGDLSWEGFEKLGDVTYYDRTDTQNEAEVIERIGTAELVITNKVTISRNIIETCPSIKYLGLLSTGYNVIDLEAASERNIPVTNVPGYGSDAVAQFTFALLLEICNRVGYHSDVVKEGKWTRCSDFCFWDYPLKDISGKTLGLVGYGAIGKTVANIAKAFGMKVIVYTRTIREEEGITHVDLDTLFAQADVISLHCPLFENTKGMINKESIKKMKDGVILLNTSRGPLIEEADVAKALKSGKIYAAGLDVIESEPMKENHPLMGIENCIITPHIAWASKEARERLMEIAVENLKGFLEGKNQNVVNTLK